MLLRRTPSSYTLAPGISRSALAAALLAEGWRQIEARGDEVARFGRGDGAGNLALISCYTSGALVVGGPRRRDALATLDQLLTTTAAEQHALFEALV